MVGRPIGGVKQLSSACCEYFSLLDCNNCTLHINTCLLSAPTHHSSSLLPGEGLDPTGVMPRLQPIAPPAGLAAGQARDDDIEEGDDAIDDSSDNGADGVHNCHKDIADCAENGFEARDNSTHCSGVVSGRLGDVVEFGWGNSLCVCSSKPVKQSKTKYVVW